MICLIINYQLSIVNYQLSIVNYQLSIFPNSPRLEEDAQQNQADSDVEREIDFTPFTEDEESQDNGVAWL